VSGVTEQALKVNSDSVWIKVPGAQRQLFPLDTWGAESAFAVIDEPYPGIKRAMVGPLCLGGHDQPEESLKCLAVAEDGMFLACMRVSRNQLASSTAAWKRVLHGLDVARQYPVSVKTVTEGDVPLDCLECWSSLAFWVPHPRGWNPVPGPLRALFRLLQNHYDAPACPPTNMDVPGMLALQVASAVSEVSLALNPRLHGALTMRPKMSVSMAHRLLVLAEAHGVKSQRYALQALNTESLGLLHLAASGHPDCESSRVRDAIFSGTSLPETLARMGVAKATHKRSLKEIPQSAFQAPSTVLSLSEHLIAGRDWLRAMRLAGDVLTQAQLDWKEFLLLEHKISLLNLQRAETVCRILQWCLQPKYQRNYRFELVARYARSIARLASDQAGITVTYDDAFNLALELVQQFSTQTISDEVRSTKVKPENLWQVLSTVSRLRGQTATKLMHTIFDAHPGIPAGFCMPESVAIFPLDSVELTKVHGMACDVCIQNPQSVIEYVTGGCALYGVMSADGTIGTIALIFDKTADPHRVQLLQLSGADNSAPHPDVTKLAGALADSWVDEPQLARWEHYMNQCERWVETVSP
jgi:hypothetical protein